MPDGRAISPLVNRLLRLPIWTVRVATKDWHPADHVSFASNHPGDLKPFVDSTTIVNPYNEHESYVSRLWPVHCVQGTPGAELVPELDASMVDKVVEKGTDARVEMYSAFYDPFVNPRVSDSGLLALLKEKDVTDVYVVGLAADYCVKCTAADAAAEGFKTFLIEEGTRAVDSAQWEDAVKKELSEKGVNVVSVQAGEVKRLGLGPE